MLHAIQSTTRRMMGFGASPESSMLSTEIIGRDLSPLPIEDLYLLLGMAG